MNYQQLDISFYETIPLQGGEEKMAKGQEAEILNYMRLGGFHDCWSLKEKFPYMEITSIRRGLWNLENKFKKIDQVGWVKGKKNFNVGQFKAK